MPVENKETREDSPEESQKILSKDTITELAERIDKFIKENREERQDFPENSMIESLEKSQKILLMKKLMQEKKILLTNLEYLSNYSANLVQTMGIETEIEILGKTYKCLYVGEFNQDDKPKSGSTGYFELLCSKRIEMLYQGNFIDIGGKIVAEGDFLKLFLTKDKTFVETGYISPEQNLFITYPSIASNQESHDNWIDYLLNFVADSISDKFLKTHGNGQPSNSPSCCSSLLQYFTCCK